HHVDLYMQADHANSVLLSLHDALPISPAGALSFHRGWRNGSRELFEGGDGLEGAQEHGGGPRRARHPDFAFPPRLSRTQRLYDEPYKYRSAQDGLVCEILLAARPRFTHRFL